MAHDLITFFDLETLGFDKFSDQIVCASIKECDGASYSFFGADEETLVRDFFAKVEELKPYKVVSFNGYSFDVPFLWTRALKYGIKVPKVFNDKTSHADLWYLLTRRGKGKLSDFAHLLGHESIGTGAEVPLLFKMRDFDSIVKHCESDLANTEALFKRARECGLLG